MMEPTIADRRTEITRIMRKIEIVWMHVPKMSLMRLLRDNFGDQGATVTNDAQLEIRLDEILASVTERKEGE